MPIVFRYFCAKKAASCPYSGQGCTCNSRKTIEYQITGVTGNLNQPTQTFYIFNGWMENLMFLLPCRIVSSFWILLSKPAIRKSCLVFLIWSSPSHGQSSLFLTVLQEGSRIKYSTSLLTKDYPLCVVCKAAFQIPNTAQGAFSITRQFLMENPAARKQ